LSIAVFVALKKVDIRIKMASVAIAEYKLKIKILR
jgi:hypothetical protein